MKKVIFSTYISFIISILYVILFFHQWSFLHWSNALFYIGLVYLMIGCIILVWSSNFFSAFLYSFKHFFRVISKKEQVIQEIEGRKTAFLQANKQHIPSKPWIYIGVCYCLVSIIFSLQIVYFGR